MRLRKTGSSWHCIHGSLPQCNVNSAQSSSLDIPTPNNSSPSPTTWDTVTSHSNYRIWHNLTLTTHDISTLPHSNLKDLWHHNTQLLYMWHNLTPNYLWYLHPTPLQPEWPLTSPHPTTVHVTQPYPQLPVISPPYPTPTWMTFDITTPNYCTCDTTLPPTTCDISILPHSTLKDLWHHHTLPQLLYSWQPPL